MRKVRYSLAVSLDGFIAGPNGEFDWIEMDPSLEFESFFKEFDTVIMGRRTFEVAQKGPGGGTMPGIRTIVCSKTLRPSKDSPVAIVKDAAATVAELKTKTGKDIWLFGGGTLFRSLLDANLVDTIEVAVMPIMLSKGIPLLPLGSRSPRMRLVECKALPSGIVALTYALSNTARRKRKSHSHMKQKPNKAPEPTPGSVTPRASLRVIESKQKCANRHAARGAPAPGVAHL